MGVLGVIIAALASVVVYQNKKIEALYKEKDGLQEARRSDMVEVNNKQNEILGNFVRTSELLLAKLSGEKK